MNYAKKMILVPYDASCCTPELTTVQTPGNSMTRLDEEMGKILNSRNFPSDREKWSQYSQTLQRYLNLVGPEKQPQATSTIEELVGLTDQNIVNNVPKSFRHKTKLFIDFLRQTNAVTWDNTGRVSVEGKVIPGANIVDIVNDVARSRRNFYAIGRDVVSRALRNVNIPRSLIGNEDFWNDGVPANVNIVEKYRDVSGISPMMNSSTESHSTSSSLDSTPNSHGPVSFTMRPPILPAPMDISLIDAGPSSMGTVGNTPVRIANRPVYAPLERLRFQSTPALGTRHQQKRQRSVTQSAKYSVNVRKQRRIQTPSTTKQWKKL